MSDRLRHGLYIPIIVGGREVQVAAEALDLGIEARYPAVKTASGNAGLIVGGEIPRTDELADRMFRRARRTVDVFKALSDNEEPDIGMHEKVDGQTGQWWCLRRNRRRLYAYS